MGEEMGRDIISRPFPYPRIPSRSQAGDITNICSFRISSMYNIGGMPVLERLCEVIVGRSDTFSNSKPLD